MLQRFVQDLPMQCHGAHGMKSNAAPQSISITRHGTTHFAVQLKTGALATSEHVHLNAQQLLPPTRQSFTSRHPCQVKSHWGGTSAVSPAPADLLA